MFKTSSLQTQILKCRNSVGYVLSGIGAFASLTSLSPLPFWLKTCIDRGLGFVFPTRHPFLGVTPSERNAYKTYSGSLGHGNGSHSALSDRARETPDFNPSIHTLPSRKKLELQTRGKLRRRIVSVQVGGWVSTRIGNGGR